MQAPHYSEEIIAQSGSKTHEGRTIIVALDISQRSRDAFAWTVANLYRAGDNLSLIHVSPRPQVVTTGAYTSPIHTMSLAEKREGHIMLRNYAKYCLVNNLTHEVRHFVGDAGYVVGQLSTKQTGGSTLVMGNHNKSSTEHFFLGSVSESAVHSAHIPIVIIKRPHKVSVDPDNKRRIGICVDSSEQARAAFDWVINEMFREDDYVFVLHMSSTRSDKDTTVVDDEAGKDTILDQYAHLMEDRSTNHHIVSSRSHKALPVAAASLANSLDLDCLVVGSRGLGTVRRTIFGSFSDKLVRACKCNIVVVKS